MPLVVVGISHDTVAIGIPIEFQFTRIRVALEPLAPGAHHVKPVEVAVHDARHESSPESICVLYQKTIRILLKGRGNGASRIFYRYVNLSSVRGPGAKRGSATDE